MDIFNIGIPFIIRDNCRRIGYVNLIASWSYLDVVTKVLERLLTRWTFQFNLAPVNQASETKDMATVGIRFVDMRTQTNSAYAVIVFSNIAGTERTGFFVSRHLSIYVNRF
jgi:hypothetical protein